MESVIAGRVPVVTGAGRSVGRAVARQLAELGTTVPVGARTAAAACRTAEELSDSGDVRPVDVAPSPLSGRRPGVLVNAVCPGLTATYPGAEAMGARPVADGTASVVWAVTPPDSGPTGGFFRDGQPLPW